VCISWFSKIQIGFTFLVLAHSGSLGQRAVKQVLLLIMAPKMLSCMLSTWHTAVNNNYTETKPENSASTARKSAWFTASDTTDKLSAKSAMIKTALQQTITYHIHNMWWRPWQQWQRQQQQQQQQQQQWPPQSHLGRACCYPTSENALCHGSLHYCAAGRQSTHTHTQLFYGSVNFVRDNPVEPVPEETFTHSHSLWSSIILICFLHLLRSMASSLFNPRGKRLSVIWLRKLSIR